MPREVDFSKYRPKWTSPRYNQYTDHLGWNPEMSEYIKFMYSKHGINFEKQWEDPETFPNNYYTHNKAFQAKWLGSDNKFAFDNNLKSYEKYLQTYIDNPITYNINNLLFRSDFDYVPNKKLKVDLHIGDSFTVGMGLHTEDTFSHLISQHTGYTPVNLGVGGGGIRMSYINFKKFVDFYDVQNVFHYQPYYMRTYHFENNKHNNFVSKDILQKMLKDGFKLKEYTFPGDSLFSQGYIEDTLLNWGYNTMDVSCHIDAIRGCCDRMGIKYYFFSKIPGISWFSLFQLKENNNDVDALPSLDHDTPARDLGHFSTNVTKVVANWFKDAYDEHDSFIGFDTDINANNFNMNFNII